MHRRVQSKDRIHRGRNTSRRCRGRLSDVWTCNPCKRRRSARVPTIEDRRFHYTKRSVVVHLYPSLHRCNDGPLGPWVSQLLPSPSIVPGLVGPRAPPLPGPWRGHSTYPPFHPGWISFCTRRDTGSMPWCEPGVASVSHVVGVGPTLRRNGFLGRWCFVEAEEREGQGEEEKGRETKQGSPRRTRRLQEASQRDAAGRNEAQRRQGVESVLEK